MKLAETVVPHFFSGDARADREEATAQGLGDQEHVGNDAELRAAEQRARAPEPGLDFIHDAEDAVLAAQVDRLREVVGGRNNAAALALDRLEDHGPDVLGAGGQQLAKRVDIAERDVAEAGGRSTEVLLIAGLAGGGQGAERLAVKTVDGGDDAVPAGTRPGQLDRGLDGFRATVDKRADAQIARGDRR